MVCTSQKGKGWLCHSPEGKGLVRKWYHPKERTQPTTQGSLKGQTKPPRKTLCVHLRLFTWQRGEKKTSGRRAGLVQVASQPAGQTHTLPFVSDGSRKDPGMSWQYLEFGGLSDRPRWRNEFKRTSDGPRRPQHIDRRESTDGRSGCEKSESHILPVSSRHF